LRASSCSWKNIQKVKEKSRLVTSMRGSKPTSFTKEIPRYGLTLAKKSYSRIPVILTAAVATTIELPDYAAKKGSGRKVPLHGDLHRALTQLRAATQGSGPVVVSERGSSMTPLSVVIWFANAYRLIGLDGCSSHSGPRGRFPWSARYGAQGA
jgi:hypothetical protein